MEKNRLYAKEHVILIVEDSVVVVKLLSAAFQRAGFRVVTANDGLEALERAIKEDISLIVTDLNMPEMDGITLLNELKENSSTKNIPVILMSSNIPGKAEIAKAFAFLQKPFDEEKIINVVGDAIKEVYGSQG